jgi:hypothetical protein
VSDLDKMMAFGSWLTARRLQLHSELFALSVNRAVPVDAIRIKAGHLENTVQILEVFAELYNGDLQKFMQEHLGQEPEKEDKESEDVSHGG